MSQSPKRKATKAVKQPRSRAAKTTRDNILRSAKRIFSKEGYSGARVDRISKAARSHDSLIYYYFGSKEKLFVAVLENAYQDMVEAGKALTLNPNDPIQSFRTITEFPFRYYLKNPELIVLLGTENLQQGKHIAKSDSVDHYSLPVIKMLEDVVKQGQELGLFQPNINCRQLYMAMTALGYFYVSNRYTFSTFLNTDLMQESETEAWARYISDLLLLRVQQANNNEAT